MLPHQLRRMAVFGFFLFRRYFLYRLRNFLAQRIHFQLSFQNRFNGFIVRVVIILHRHHHFLYGLKVSSIALRLLCFGPMRLAGQRQRLGVLQIRQRMMGQILLCFFIRIRRQKLI